VVGKVTNHDYFEVPWGKIYLPRILLVDGSWYFYSTTNSAIESGEFTEGEEGLVRADGAPITLDMSITSHLLYLWFGLLLTFFITIWASGKYKRGTGTKTEPKGPWHNMFEVLFVFIRDDIAKEFIPHGKHEKFVPYLYTIFMVITFLNLFGCCPGVQRPRLILQ
jgi:F-type H+-transporting ATPase subunit a